MADLQGVPGIQTSALNSTVPLMPAGGSQGSPGSLCKAEKPRVGLLFPIYKVEVGRQLREVMMNPLLQGCKEVPVRAERVWNTNPVPCCREFNLFLLADYLQVTHVASF